MTDSLSNILNNLPDFLDTEPTSKIYKLFKSIAVSLDNFKTQSNNLKSSIQITTASGNNLDDIGSLFKLKRTTGETDTQFRQRILSFWESSKGGGTTDSISKAIERLGIIDINNVSITTTTPKFINIDIYPQPSELGFDGDLVYNTIMNTKSAGVYPLITTHLNVAPFSTITQTAVDSFSIYDLDEGEFFKIGYTRVGNARVGIPFYTWVNIDNTAGDIQTDYQIKISLTPANTDFWLNCKDKNSIYIKDANNKTMLSYWIQDYDDVAQTATIWVKIPFLPNSVYNIYLYYGSGNYSSYNNIDNTMVFGDDFDGSSLDGSKWTGTATVSGGEATISGGNYILSTSSWGYGYILEQRFKETGTAGTKCGFGINNLSYNQIMVGFGPWIGFRIFWNDGSGTISQYTIDDTGTYKNYKFVRVSSSNVQVHINDVLITTLTSNLPTINLGINATTTSSSLGHLDWVFIRKYQAVEPTITLL